MSLDTLVAKLKTVKAEELETENKRYLYYADVWRLCSPVIAVASKSGYELQLQSYWIASHIRGYPDAHTFYVRQNRQLILSLCGSFTKGYIKIEIPEKALLFVKEVPSLLAMLLEENLETKQHVLDEKTAFYKMLYAGGLR